MHELFKNTGLARHVKSWRGILLADVLGKKVRRIQRRWMTKFTEQICGQLQFG
mgnify:CR=1 FL=1